MIDSEVLQTAIKGINREIKNRERQLIARRAWYLNPEQYAGYDSGYSFTMAGFYFGGYKIMQEIKKLRLIKESINK